MDRKDDVFHTTASDKNLAPVLHGLDYLLVALSNYHGYICTRKFGWDDAVMLDPSGKAFITVEIVYRLGQHRSTLSADIIHRNFLKYYYLDTAQFFIAHANLQDFDMFIPPTLLPIRQVKAYLVGLDSLPAHLASRRFLAGNLAV
ncbi:MAG: hypothetical protein LQ341_002513 [Variospora aurantia]|nr:MAG: hypothetical protein LQ341_002513 [Variospora aurantia]